MKKSILVTGSGRGAGRGIANVLAEGGGKIVVCDLDPTTAESAAQEAQSRGAAALGVACDMSDEQQVEALFDEVLEFTEGRLDAVINTVAWVDPPGPIVDLPTDRWHKALATNLDSVMFSTRAALRVMIPARSGVIINVSSLNGTRGFPERPSYGATKAAVINFTQTTAMENREHGIRANCLVPGAIDGERLRLLRELRMQREAETGASSRNTADFYPDPPIELLDPEWIGRFVRFLISDDGRHINGQSLVVGEAPRSPLQAMFPDL